MLREIARLDRLLKEERDIRAAAVLSLEERLGIAQQEALDAKEEALFFKEQVAAMEKKLEAYVRDVVADMLELLKAEPVAPSVIVMGAPIVSAKEQPKSTTASSESANKDKGFNGTKLAGPQFKGLPVKLPGLPKPSPRTPRPAATTPLDAMPTPRMTPRIFRSPSGNDLQPTPTVTHKAWDEFEQEMARISARLGKGSA